MKAPVKDLLLNSHIYIVIHTSDVQITKGINCNFPGYTLMDSLKVPGSKMAPKWWDPHDPQAVGARIHKDT